MSSALVAEIKRMAVHDGPGIRTTVFLKGCPLSCIWCHNPECISVNPTLLYWRERCIDCGECSTCCNYEAQHMENGHHYFDRMRCVSCGECVQECFAEALSLCGQERSIDEIFAEVTEDAAFYDQSGGGVTLSGGEPLLYPEFCRDFFSLVQTAGIHTALDTSACISWHALEIVLPQTDLLLIDFKHPDPERHRVLTGLDNSLVLNNLQRLQQYQIPIEIRLPLIPGLNDSPEDLADAGHFLSGLPQVQALRLLPYHPFARSKYQACGRPDTLPDISPATPEALQCAADILKKQMTHLAIICS